MTLTFYNYNGSANNPNKIAKSTLVKTVDISEIQLVKQDGLIALLGEFIAANYATYVVGSKKYVCTVEFLSTGNNTWQYTLTVDAVATAWENGVFDSWAVCERSNEGAVLFDSELQLSNIPTTETIPFDDNDGETVVALSVLSSAPVFTNSHPTSNPAIRTYLLSLSQFRNFFLKFLEATPLQQKIYGPSVIGIRIIDNGRINTRQRLSTGGNNVTLYTFNTETVGNANVNIDPESTFTNTYVDADGQPVTVTVVQSGIFAKNNSLSIDCGSTVLELNPYIAENSYTYVSKTYSFTATYYNVNSVFSLDIAGAGVITFTPSELPTSEITSVGYAVACDPLSGMCRYFLTINGNIVPYKSLSCCVPGTAPFAYDNSVTDWSRVTASVLSSLISGGASAIAGNPVGVLSSLVGGLSTYGSARLEQQTGSYAVSGSVGWSPDKTVNSPTKLTRVTYTVANSDYRNYFGKPDNGTRKLSTLTGYVRTKNCNLYNQGLPRWIIDETKSTLDGEGVFIEK